MIVEITEFVESFSVPEHTGTMEEMIAKTIGYSQWLGGRINTCEADYHKFYAEKLDSLSRMEDETETTRKAKLNAWTADKKHNLQDLKLLNGNLKSIRMALMQAVKTRREEPR